MKKYFTFLMTLNFLFVGIVALNAQYTGNPVYPSSTSGGGPPSEGEYIDMNCQINGNTGTFRVGRTAPAGLPAGTMTIREGTISGPIVATESVSASDVLVTLSTTFTHTSSSKTYFARFEESSGSFYAYTGGLEVSYSAPPTTPPTPSNFRTTLMINNEDIRLTWNDVSGETQYQIYRQVNGGSFSFYTSVSANTTLYMDESLTPQSTYCYKIRACNGSSNCSSFTSSDCETLPDPTPNTPSYISATPYYEDDYIRVSFNNVINETSYQLQKSTNGGSYTTIQTFSPSSVDVVYFDYSVNPNVSYCYRARACNGSYCSPYTSVDCATIVPPPDDVTGLTAVLTANDDVLLNWNNASGATSYRIERKDPGQNWTVIQSNWGSSNYTDVNVVPGETYQYRILGRDGSTTSVNYSNIVTISIPGTPASITITYPSGGETFTTGDMVTITWTNTNFTGNVYVKYLLENGWQFATNNISNTGSYTWTIPNVVNTVNNAKISVASLDGTIVDESNTFIVNPNTSGVCTYMDVDDETPWATTAATFLCENGVLDDDGTADPSILINRAELAKILYTALDLDQYPIVNSTIKYYPSVFNDLQNTSLWDYQFAKVLSYLEYDGDCITPFDRNAFNFYCADHIERKFLVKAVLEAWNISVDGVTGTMPFTDVSSSDPMYDYILKAYQVGIINGDNNDGMIFRPDAKAIRAEAFVMLYNAMQLGIPAINANDFYEPGNYTPTNFAQASSSHSGNFNFYTKTSFAISSIGLPLNFGHTYNSYLGDMPKEFFAMQPLGNAWSHSYNMYLLDVPGSQTGDRRLVLVLPDGTVNIFKQNGNTYVPETYGIYSTLTKTSGSTFQLTTKGQIVFTFTLGTTTINSFGTSIYQLTRIQDRNNNTVSLTYENAVTTSFARLKSIRGTAGRYIRLYYENNSDRIRRVIDPLGRAIFYTYQQAANGKEQLKTFSNAKGDITTYNYNNSDCEAHLLESITLPKGNTIDNQYENRKLLSTQTNSANLTTFTRNFVHNANGTVVNSTTDIADYGIITSTHNSNGLLTEMTTPSADLDIDYSSPNSTLPSIINSSNLNGAMVYVYDDKANVLEINMPEGVRHQFTYEDFNDLKTYTNPNNQTWTYGYDANGNLITQQSPRAMTTMNRLSNGLVSRITNPENIITNFSYDNYGNVENVSIPAEGISSAAEYDIASRLIESTNPNGQKTFYTYDENDNLLTSQFTYTSQYQYDKNDNLTRITNAKGIATNLSYDFQNDFHTGTSFAGMNDAYTYYEDGRLESHTNPKGTTFTYNYDNQNRIQSLNSSGDNVAYNYDNLDRMTSVSNNLGTVQFAYDNLNRVINTTDTYGNTVSYTYDPASNITHITYPDGKVVTYTYYNDNLLHTVEDWNNQTTTYTYRDDGLLSRIDYPNGAECSYQYDGAGRNTNQTWQRNNVILASYARTFDPFGNITQEEATHPLEATTPSDKNVTYSYEDNNQIAVANATTFDFDADGTASSKSNAYTYTFDNYERLTGISGDLTAAFDYDAMGHRRSKTVNGTTTRFVLDILGMSKVLMEKTASGTVQNYYVYGLTLISRIGGDGNTTHYYHGDYRGSTVAMTDASGNTTHRYAYGSYGQNLSVDEPSGDINPFRYVGMYGVQYEADDLYFMRARYYDGEVGRFLSEDPVWHQNLFVYVYRPKKTLQVKK